MSVHRNSLTAFLNPFNAQNVGNAVQQFSNGYLVNDKGSIMFPMSVNYM